MYTETGRYSEAEDLYLRGLELKRRMDVGEENLYFLQNVGELGTMYRKSKQYDEAQQWLLKAEEIARRVFGNDHKITNTSVTNLIALYESWNKPEKVEQWRAKLPKEN
jgi:tetratricopeptide (TPR) repeat protein